jgi:hypothetical protein
MRQRKTLANADVLYQRGRTYARVSGGDRCKNLERAIACFQRAQQASTAEAFPET